MTTIQTNKIGLDVVDIQVECTGESFTDMYFQEPVLDAERNYVLGISELSVPLADEPLITKDPRLREEVIFRFIRKRDVNGAVHAGADQRLIDAEQSLFRLDKALISSPADFLYSISQFAFDFSYYLNNLSVMLGSLMAQPDYEIKVLSTPSGILRFRGNGNFWADYAIELTKFGQEIFGYDQEIIGVAWPAARENPSTTVLLDGAGTFLLSNHQNYGDSIEVPLKYSVFRYLENRLRIEVDADLAIPSNILVENGVHKLHYNIASYALPQEYRSIGTVDTNPVVNAGTQHESKLHVGNTLIKKKASPTTDWYRLMEAANVQNMRLHLLMVRRVWDRSVETWRLTRDKIEVGKNQTWFATLKFVEQF